jgi:hypothetical protein
MRHMFTITAAISNWDACRKRRLKWVATLPLWDINTEAWSSGMGVVRGANNPTL